jgi:hypothetical protein
MGLRITLARIPLGIHSNLKSISQSRSLFALALRSIYWVQDYAGAYSLGEFLTSKNPKLLRNLRVFLFFSLVNMNVDRCKNKKPGTCVLGFCL